MHYATIYGGGASSTPTAAQQEVYDYLARLPYPPPRQKEPNPRIPL